MQNETVELLVEDLSSDGKSVSHLGGKVVFLDRGLPGETVRALIVRSKRNYDEAHVEEIVHRSEHRVEPLCEHFEYCGGCAWQDLQYQQQLAFKLKQVKDCLQRLGGLAQVPVKDVVGAVELFGYRNKMEFSFHTGSDGGFALGLHRRGRYDDIFDLNRCHLQSDLSNQIVSFVRDYVAENGLPVYDIEAHTGFVRFLVIRQAKRTAQVMVNLVTAGGDIPDRKFFVTRLRERFPQVTTIVQNQNTTRSNIAVGQVENVLYGTGYIVEQLFDKTFRIRANSFFQTNTMQTEALYRLAFEMTAPSATDRVLDLYCGAGSIGILISAYVAEVVGVELVPDSVRTAQENAQANGVRNVTFNQGDVKDFLRVQESQKASFDIIIVDPPRAGLHPKALKRILEIRPGKLTYISCNPATFARDAGRLTASGYRLPEVRPIDMFPHTRHVELAAVFLRE